MILNLNTDKINAIYKDKAIQAMKVVSNQLATYVQGKIRSNKSIVTGNLINSIQVGEIDEENLSVKVRTDVVYAPRVEFGFIGRDKLGRYYNQAPKSFMRATIYERNDKLVRLFGLLMKRLWI